MTLSKLLTLICPNCKTPLIQLDQKLECRGCKQIYPIINAIPSFLKIPDEFYRKYYQTELGRQLARGHLGFKNLFLNILLDMRTKISIVGKRQRFFEKIFSRDKNRLILDLGCGGGNKFFTKYGNVVGVDFELTPLETAKGIYNMVIHSDITTLPFENNAFDYVVSADVIEHVPPENKDKLFSEIYRVLKTGGKTAHVIETDSNNFLYRFAHKYPDLFQKSFIEGMGGHFGLEMPEDVLKRFTKHKLRLIRVEKIWGIIWSTEEYILRFDNEYKIKSKLIKWLVLICKILSRNIFVHGIANILLGIPNYLIERFTPLNHARGISVACKKC
ncbi:MAG: methyltransferase domain-containing protein [Candidatus Omnitrophica bacterium]|nr:methyltransferase domain-containing protein [Candidatus Omnitrophota bacterium]